MSKNRFLILTLLLISLGAGAQIIAQGKVIDANKDMILVGIGYKDFIEMDSLRARDYTFPVALPSDSFPVSGGAARFLSFIANELIPRIDSIYRTDASQRTLMGHSLGGYFCLYAMRELQGNSNYLFSNFISASPSIHYYNNYLPMQYEDFHPSPTGPKINLLICYGGMEDAEENTGREGSDLMDSFVELLRKKQNENFNVEYQLFPSYGHMETAIPAFMRALQRKP